MGVVVWACLPETKGRSLEGMDEVFGSAYGGRVEQVVVVRGRGEKGESLDGEGKEVGGRVLRTAGEGGEFRTNVEMVPEGHKKEFEMMVSQTIMEGEGSRIVREDV